MINRKALISFIILLAAFVSILTIQRLGNRGSVEASKILKAGDFAPKLKLTTLDGETIDLEQLKGKAVLVNFWATWCPPCIEEIPSLIKTYDEFKGRGLVILGITIDANGKKIIPNFVKEHNINYPVILDVDQRFSRSFSVFGVPENILIDKTGKIVARRYGADDWLDPKARKQITDLLK